MVLVLQLRGYFDLRHPRADHPKNMLEELAPRQRRLNHQRQLVLVLHLAQLLHQRRSQRT